MHKMDYKVRETKVNYEGDKFMPITTVKLAKGRTVEQKQQFVEAITKEAVKNLNVKEEWVTIIFDD